GDKIAALVLDRDRTFEPLQRHLCLLVAEVGGTLVIGFGSVLLSDHHGPRRQTPPSAPARRDDFAPPPSRTRRGRRHRPSDRRCRRPASGRAGIAPRRW